MLRIWTSPASMTIVATVALTAACQVSQSQPSRFGGALEETLTALQGFSYGRYMEGNCHRTSIPNWESYPTQECSYQVSGANGPATVVLLNGSDEQLARWITSACLQIEAPNISSCAKRLARHIREQSGAQFPVAGIVLEDMDGDGVANQFSFKDGVAVAVDGVILGKKGAPSAAETSAALTADPRSAKKFARIAGTTREQFLAFKPETSAADVEGIGWLAVVRHAYQEAWGQDANALISAWASANASFLRSSAG